MTSADENRRQFNADVDKYVEDHYGHVMAPYQRDLVKRMIKNEPYPEPRPYIHRHCQRIAKEVIAVICAGQSA